MNLPRPAPAAARPRGVPEPAAGNEELLSWVRAMASLCGAEDVYWCDGSEGEREALTNTAVRNADVERLDAARYAGCLYARSKENDVARVEDLTFICTRAKEDAGPTNHWMEPQEAIRKLSEIFKNSMRGRTMYVVPFLMGVPGSAFNKIGVQLTDSLYVVLNMRIMTRMGKVALDELGTRGSFTRCLHSKADLDEKKRYICHFPEDNMIWSVGTNYGGNVLMGKKCLALRIGSWLGRREGWLAEHMLIMGIEDPQGRTHFIAASFPSQCGKTNLAMLVPPGAMPGFKIWTVGDDIAWLRVGQDGRLWALNPENGFFGVAPGTSSKTNPNALKAIQKNTIFTNVVKTKDGGVWWEGSDDPPPSEGALDWRGRPWTPASGLAGAHANSRFTAPLAQCPSLWPDHENPQGVPISAIIFGGRRARLDPLVYESFNWQHGVYTGATMSSETTAAAAGKTGVVRRDPMAMLPFCGYHMGDYFSHWLKMGELLRAAPKIYHVNWFRKDQDGRFIWPGFGDNLRVLEWILRRVDHRVDAKKTAIGFVPYARDIRLEGSGLDASTLDSQLLSVDPEEWLEEVREQERFFSSFGSRFPAALTREREDLTKRLSDEVINQRKEKFMQLSEEILHKHPFFKGVHEWYLEQMARHAREEVFDDGDYLICEGSVANDFYLITQGQVIIGLGATDKTFKPVQTLKANDIVGWSWLLPPHQWHFDAVADGPVKAIVLDGKYLRTKCEEDPELGYELLKRMTGKIVDRLNALRTEVLRK